MVSTKVLRVAKSPQRKAWSPLQTSLTKQHQTTQWAMTQMTPTMRTKVHVWKPKGHPNFHVARVICLSSKTCAQLTNKSLKVDKKRKCPHIWSNSTHLKKVSLVESIWPNKLNGVNVPQQKLSWKLPTNSTSSTVSRTRKWWPSN